MNIGIVGLGSVGVALARELQRAGHKPIGFTSTQRDGRYEVVEKGRTHRVELETHNTVSDDLVGRFDLLVFCLKNHVLVRVFPDYEPLLRGDGVILCAQNGVMEYFLAERFDPARLLGALVRGSLIGVSPTRVEIPQPIGLVVGPFQKGATGRTAEALRIFDGTRFSRTVDAVLPFKWTKLVFSSVANPLSAITGLYAGEVFRNRRALGIGTRIIDEVLQVADAEGVALGREGPVSVDWFRHHNRLPQLVKVGILGLFSFALRGIKVSMLQDVEQGRPTEIDYLNGFVVDRARRHGIETPFNELTVRLVKELESGQRQPGLASLRDYDRLEA